MKTSSELTVDEVLAKNQETVVLESVRVTTTGDDGVETTSIVSEVGAADFDLYQRYARPFAYSDSDERHHFAAWRVQLETGGVEEGVRVTSAKTGPANPPAYEQATWVHPDFEGDLQGDGTIQVMLRLRDFPDWDIPVLPDPATVAALSYADGLDLQQAARDAREALMDQASADLSAYIDALGGTVVAKVAEIGWLYAEVPAASAANIATHVDVQTAIPAGAYTGAIGAGRTDLRPTTLVGVEPYWNASQLGDQPNPNKHAYGAITVAVVEAGPIKDEASAFCTNPSCSSTKIAKRFRCDQSGTVSCIEVSNYPTALEHFNLAATDHATTVATTVVADYMDNQPYGSTFDRPAATSDAREAKLIHIGALGGFGESPTNPNYSGNTGDVTFTNAFLVALWERVDVITSGTFISEGGAGTCASPPQCSLPAVAPWEMMVENAFDNGAFLAILPGNNCGPLQSTCTVASPAHIPKVFTVNGLMGFPACASDYRTCPLDICPPGTCSPNPIGNSARGGADARIGAAGTLQEDAVTVIDLAVPQNVTHFTRCRPTGTSTACSATGFVVENGGDLGTSFANPRVAGHSILAKDYFLDTGQTWFNAPGWLHVYMLGQGDSHRSATPNNPAVLTTRASTGADMFYGLGRVKLRRPDQFGLYGHDFRSLSFTTTTPYEYFVGEVPLHSATEILKCVMAQHEDMSHKDDIAHVRLETWLRAPVDGRCRFDGASQGYLSDPSYDTKKMVAFRASSGAVGGSCAHVKVTPLVLPSRGAIWTQLFCYAADEEDDAPN